MKKIDLEINQNNSKVFVLKKERGQNSIEISDESPSDYALRVREEDLKKQEDLKFNLDTS